MFDDWEKEFGDTPDTSGVVDVTKLSNKELLDLWFVTKEDILEASGNVYHVVNETAQGRDSFSLREAVHLELHKRNLL